MFSTFGIPSEIVSDNGSVFTSSLFAKFIEGLGIKLVHSAVYHPQANSLIGRFHRTFKSRLKRLNYSNPTERLSDLMSQVLFDIRATPSVMTGVSPFTVLFGRPMSTKLSMIVSKEKSIECKKRDVFKEYSKRRGWPKEYNVGDKVWIRLGGKGPFIIAAVIFRRINQYTYEVKTDAQKLKIINQRDIKFRFNDQDNHLTSDKSASLFMI